MLSHFLSKSRISETFSLVCSCTADMSCSLSAPGRCCITAGRAACRAVAPDGRAVPKGHRHSPRNVCAALSLPAPLVPMKLPYINVCSTCVFSWTAVSSWTALFPLHYDFLWNNDCVPGKWGWVRILTIRHVSLFTCYIAGNSSLSSMSSCVSSFFAVVQDWPVSYARYSVIDEVYYV